MKKDQLKERYLSSVSSYRHLEKKEERIILILSVLRLLIFFGGVIIVWTGFTKSVFAGVALTFILIVLFLYLLKLFSDYSGKKEFLANLVLINQNEADALSGNLSAFDAGCSYADIKHDFSFDVDIF
jgi:uncharacterized membrane protein (DUF485 family)